MTLEELVVSARRAGLDALCLTEHDLAWDSQDLADASAQVGFPLISGVEVTTDVGHVLVFGELRRPLWQGYLLEELAVEAAETGLALVLPHPLRYIAGERATIAGVPRPGAAEIAATASWSLVHAIEVASTQSIPGEHVLASEAAVLGGFVSVGGSDAHHTGKAGAYATRFERSVKNAAELSDELRAGRVVPVTNTLGPELTN